MKHLKTFESYKFNENVKIDISGPDGNSYALIAYGKKFAKQLNIDFKPIHNEMISGDYENLLSVFNKYFGQVVDLVGNEEETEYIPQYESIKRRSVKDSLSYEQIEWIKDEILPLDDLDLAMAELQKVIVQTDDGGICGVYFSKYDDANDLWYNSTPEQRMEEVMSYLELEEAYDGLKDDESDTSICGTCGEYTTISDSTPYGTCECS